MLRIHPEILALLMRFKAKQAPVSVKALAFSLPTGASAVSRRKKEPTCSSGRRCPVAEADVAPASEQPHLCCASSASHLARGTKVASLHCPVDSKIKPVKCRSCEHEQLPRSFPGERNIGICQHLPSFEDAP
ncbi:hypothetical protein GRJ2_000593500 [Grus japonensis]|uniref:Uncharacterized protein n=1 Tax=Grus japonensis TaxID=30415 RepID=A0ABC9WAT1_GRUJA